SLARQVLPGHPGARSEVRRRPDMEFSRDAASAGGHRRALVGTSECRMMNAECRMTWSRRLTLSAFCILHSAFLFTACRQKMANQPRYDPLEPSDFFADGMSARPRIPGTVARGELALDGFMATGKMNGQDVDGFPMTIDAAALNRGQERFNIYCTPCHGRTGDGNG